MAAIPFLLALALGSGAWSSTAATRPDLGPGPDHITLNREGLSLHVSASPNAAQRWNTVEVALRRGGRAVRGKRVWIRFAMQAMAMGVQRFRLNEVQRGVYRYRGPAISMPGTWVLTFEVHGVQGRTLTAAVTDHVR